MIDLDPDRAPVTPRDSATVILLRDRVPGFEVFLVRRHKKSGFMAGAHVFPGGTLDESDVGDSFAGSVRGRTADEASTALGEDDGAVALGLYVAAVRETFEEAGVLLGDGTNGVDLSALRDRLNNGADFGALLAEVNIELTLDALVPWARWVTPTQEKRRYDARFFVARSPGSQSATHDRIEVTAGEWMRPGVALERAEARDIVLPPPTLRTLEQLAHETLSTTDAVFAHASRSVPTIVQPELVMNGDQITLTLPGDPEHSISARAIEGPTRFVLTDGRFRSVDP